MKAFIGVAIYCLCLLKQTNTDLLICQENEVLQQCKNPWEPTCSRPYPQGTTFFTCRPGCACKNGCVRDEVSGKCKPAKYCSKGCSDGEIQNVDSRCEPTCQGQGLARYQCSTTKNCICQPGLLRDLSSGVCVTAKGCPPVCDINEEWCQCTNPSCRRTCQNRFKDPRPCTGTCEPGCVCKMGYIWDEYCKQCVLEKDCPPECGENEEWQRCSDIKCRKTCKNLNETISCKKVCTPGCSCIKNYVYDEIQQKCVRKEQCAQECSRTEVWKICSDVGCRETCQRRQPRICDDCKPGCSCIDGYIWDESTKVCVPRWLCSETCGEHEEWCDYVPDDTPTCQSLLEPTCSRCNKPTLVGLRPGCICEKGYLFDEVSQKCITIDECFKRDPDSTTMDPSTDTTETTDQTTSASSTQKSTTGSHGTSTASTKSPDGSTTASSASSASTGSTGSAGSTGSTGSTASTGSTVTSGTSGSSTEKTTSSGGSTHSSSSGSTAASSTTSAPSSGGSSTAAASSTAASTTAASTTAKK